MLLRNNTCNPKCRKVGRKRFSPPQNSKELSTPYFQQRLFLQIIMQTALMCPRKPDIVFHRSGQINIAARLAKMLSLRQGDVIDIAHCCDGETYIYVTKRAPYQGAYRAACHRVSPRGHHMRCQCITLYRAMAVYCNQPTANSIALYAGAPVQRDGKTYIPLITHNCITK